MTSDLQYLVPVWCKLPRYFKNLSMSLSHRDSSFSHWKTSVGLHMPKRHPRNTPSLSYKTCTNVILTAVVVRALGQSGQPRSFSVILGEFRFWRHQPGFSGALTHSDSSLTSPFSRIANCSGDEAAKLLRSWRSRVRSPRWTHTQQRVLQWLAKNECAAFFLQTG